MYYIKIKTQFQGFHRYVDAPEEVSFLRDFHRHIFYVTAKVQTNHSERDVEFFIIKKKLDKFIDLLYKDKEFELSCEKIAHEIYNQLTISGYNCLSVGVSEDNENEGGYEQTKQN